MSDDELIFRAVPALIISPGGGGRLVPALIVSWGGGGEEGVD